MCGNYGALSGVVRDRNDGPSWTVDQGEDAGVALKFARAEAGVHLHFSDEDAYHIGNALLRNSTFDPDARKEGEVKP
jgi:hypothetical protein